MKHDPRQLSLFQSRTHHDKIVLCPSCGREIIAQSRNEKGEIVSTEALEACAGIVRTQVTKRHLDYEPIPQDYRSNQNRLCADNGGASDAFLFALKHRFPGPHPTGAGEQDV